METLIDMTNATLSVMEKKFNKSNHCAKIIEIKVFCEAVIFCFESFCSIPSDKKKKKGKKKE